MSSLYDTTVFDGRQEAVRLSPAAQAIYQSAISGGRQYWDLEAIGGTLLCCGVDFEQAQEVLDQVADARRLQVLRPYILQAHALALYGTALPPTVGKRLDKALDLALSGAVQILGDDLATVRSQTHAGECYTVNGCCNCPDAQGRAPWVNHRPACKHQIAVWLVRRAHVLMAEAALWGEAA